MNASVRKNRTCEVCGNIYNANHAAQRTCSRTCGLAIRAFKPRVEPTRMLRRCRICGDPFTIMVRLPVNTRTLPRNCVNCKGLVPLETRDPFDCEVCGRFVVPGQDGTHCQKHRYCSKRCQRTAHREGRRQAKDRRRARKRGAFVANVYRQDIYSRDRGRCQICGKRVTLGQAVPHPLAPVLDHIVPLAAGGKHEPANVQLAHFICNSLKSDGTAPTGDQLRLVG